LWRRNPSRCPYRGRRRAFGLCAARKGSTVYHATCTCKIGGDEMSVVDDQLRVHGLERLRVIDASVMPTVTSTNTNAPTIMIAEKGAEVIRRAARTAEPAFSARAARPARARPTICISNPVPAPAVPQARGRRRHRPLCRRRDRPRLGELAPREILHDAPGAPGRGPSNAADGSSPAHDLEEALHPWVAFDVLRSSPLAMPSRARPI